MSAKTLAHLDSIQRCGERLADAIDALDRTELRALANRYDLSIGANDRILRRAIKRRMVRAT